MGLFEDELRRAQAIKARNDAMLQASQAEQDYNNRLAAANQAAANAEAKKPGLLASVLSGIGNSIYNTGKGLGDFFTSGAINAYAGTGLKSLLEGKDYGTAAMEAKRDVEDFKKRYYNTDSAKDAYAKSAGTALDAASTLSDLIPGLGTGAKVALNVGQGVVSGAAQNIIENGENAQLGDIARGAAVGGLSAGAGQAVGGALGKSAAKAGQGTLSKALTSQVGRGAITGGVSGAVGAGANTALSGGDLGQTIGSALQGAGQGAVGGGVMAGAMGLAGKAGQKLNNKILGIDQPTTNTTTTTDIDETNGEKSNMLGRALKKTGNQLESAQTDITRAERRKFGIKDAGQTVENVRKRTGISSLQDQADFAKNVTGGDDSVMDVIQRRNMAVGKDGKPITLTADKYVVAVNDAVGKNWKKSVMGQDYNQFRDDLMTEIINEDPISAANALKSQAATQRGIADAKGPTSDKAAVKAKIYTEIANKIDDLTYSAVPQKNVNRMFDDSIDEFRMRAQEAKAAGNKKYAKAFENLANALEKTPRTIADFRTFKKDFVKSAQLAEISTGAQSGSLVAGIGKGTNVKNKMLNTLLGEPTNRALAYAGGKLNDLGDAVNGVNSGAGGKLANAIGSAVSSVNTELPSGDWQSGKGLIDTIKNPSFMTPSDVVNMPKIDKTAIAAGISGLGSLVNNQNVMTKAISRQAGQAAARNIDAEKELENARQEAQNAQADYDNAMTQAQQNYALADKLAQSQSQGQQQLDRISNAMQLALNAGDIASYAKLADLYQDAYKIYGAETAQATTEPTKLTDNQTKALNALQQLSTLEQMTPDAGTALVNSPLGFIVNATGGNDYANQAQSLALTLGYLQSGANVSAKEAENIGKSYIPTAFDSEAVRRNKLQRARELLNTYLYGTQYYQG